MTNKPNQRGFTLTELMFAMAFVAFIMIFIVTAIVQTMRIYNKGLAIRQINQSGRQLNEDLTRSLRYASSSQFALTGYPLGADSTPAQRICANGVSYVWNIETDAGLVQKNRYTASGAPPIRFARVDDKQGDLCKPGLPNVDQAKATELLGTQLVVRDLDLTTAENGKIVNIKAVISTQGLNMPKSDATSPSGYSCAKDGSGSFCAFGDFVTTVYIRN